MIVWFEELTLGIKRWFWRSWYYIRVLNSSSPIIFFWEFPEPPPSCFSFLTLLLQLILVVLLHLFCYSYLDTIAATKNGRESYLFFFHSEWVFLHRFPRSAVGDCRTSTNTFVCTSNEDHRGVFRTQSNIWDGAFCKNSLRLKVVNSYRL